MKFKNVELLPGTIIDAADPKQIGRVKCDVPGVFDSGSMNKEGFPWIYPLTQPGFQRWSTPIKGHKVWVFKTSDNYQEFWYIPMMQLTTGTKDIISGDDYENAEVLISRNMGPQSMTMYYKESEGFVIKYGNATINMNPDQEILISASNASVQLKNGKVYIGDGSEGEHAVMGDTLQELLQNLQIKLAEASSTASMNPFTCTLAKSLMECSNAIGNSVKDVVCENTLVN
jgi:hypothetical protein